MKNLIVLMSFCFSSLAMANLKDDIAYYTIAKKSVKIVDAQHGGEKEFYGTYPIYYTGYPTPDNYDRAGRIISTAKDLVALGQDIYQLVIKGKPTQVTSYAPISVVPKNGQEYVDVLDMENWQMPKKFTYEVSYENLYGMEVVRFRYSVIFSYGGSYNGKGAYITAAQIVPEVVNTVFGYDFTATMKLGGVQNNGTKAFPVASATLIMHYTINTIVKATTTADTFFITGKGFFKKF